MEITRQMYRMALHIYLVHAYPNDDLQYYSKWAWLARMPPGSYWERDFRSFDDPKDFNFPREVRFGCYASGNTKLRCYATGFMFDTNHSGDPEEIIAVVTGMKKEIEDEWARVGLPVHGRVK